LSADALYGHAAVVKTLRERDDVNPNKPGQYGQTPLCCAISNGVERVAKILFGRNVNPEKPDERGKTALWWAALKDAREW